MSADEQYGTGFSPRNELLWRVMPTSGPSTLDKAKQKRCTTYQITISETRYAMDGHADLDSMSTRSSDAKLPRKTMIAWTVGQVTVYES